VQTNDACGNLTDRKALGQCLSRNSRYASFSSMFLSSMRLRTIARHIALQFAPLFSLRIFTPPVALRGFEVAMAWRRRTEADAAVLWLKEQLRVVGRHPRG
jgi:hypothetical protein